MMSSFTILPCNYVKSCTWSDQLSSGIGLEGGEDQGKKIKASFNE